jgi:hypothetical protein
MLSAQQIRWVNQGKAEELSRCSKFGGKPRGQHKGGGRQPSQQRRPLLQLQTWPQRGQGTGTGHLQCNERSFEALGHQHRYPILVPQTKPPEMLLSSN